MPMEAEVKAEAEKKTKGWKMRLAFPKVRYGRR